MWEERETKGETVSKARKEAGLICCENFLPLQVWNDAEIKK